MAKKTLFSSYDLKNEEATDLEEIQNQDISIEDEAQINLEAIKSPYERFLALSEEIFDRIKRGEVSQFMTFEKGMHPTCKYNKSMLSIINSNNLKRGDIVLLLTPLGYCVKRIIKFVQRGIILLGDNERKYTLIIDKDNIIGKIVAKVEKTKYTSFNSQKMKKKANAKYVRFAWLRTLGRTKNEVISINGIEKEADEQIIVSTTNEIPPIDDL